MNLNNLMKQAQAMQKKMQDAQEEIGRMEVTGEAGAGLVKITLTGRHEAKKVELDPSLLQEEKEMLEDLIAAAINDAVRKIDDSSRGKMSGVTAGMKLPGGFDLPM